ncbi:hypothetical protein [Escherichia coli]|nr:hypothetical protein [Escherichia coli]
MVLNVVLAEDFDCVRRP